MVVREYRRVHSSGDHVCFKNGQDKFSAQANNVTSQYVTFVDVAAKQVFHCTGERKFRLRPTQEISRNVQQAAQGTAQVATNITEVNRGAGELRIIAGAGLGAIAVEREQPPRARSGQVP